MMWIAVIIAAVGVAWLAQVATRRARRAFAAGKCAHCGQPLGDQTYRLEGKAICASCAGRARRRLRRALLAFVVLGLVFLVVAVVGTISLLRRHDPTWWQLPLVMIGCIGGLAVAVRLALGTMKQQNRVGETIDRYNLLIDTVRPPTGPDDRAGA